MCVDIRVLSIKGSHTVFAVELSNFFLNSEGKAPDGKFFTKIILSERFVFRENVSSFTLCVVLCLLF